MKQLLTLGMAVALIASACAVRAYPTFLGPTGLFNVPTGYVTCPGELDLAVDYISSKSRDIRFQRFDAIDDVVGTATITSKSSWPLRATYGVAPNFEIGLAYDADGALGKGLWDVNAKYQIPVNVCKNTAFAIGALYGQSGDADTRFIFPIVEPPIADVNERHKVTDTMVYLVGTGTFCIATVPVAVTAGIDWNEVKFINKGNSFGGFLGVDVGITKGFDFIADVQTRAKNNGIVDSKTPWAAGFRYMYCPQWSFEAGVTTGPIIATKKTSFFIGVNYAFMFCQPK